MYNISNDPRCLKTCTLIYEALIELLEENDMVLESITISDIAKRSSVGRATFYRHFDSTLDVLRWASNSAVEDSVDAMLLSANNYQLFCYNFYAYWTQNAQLLDVLVRINRPNIFLVSLERFLTHHQEDIFGTVVESPTPGKSKQRKVKPEDRESAIMEDYLIGIWAAINWAILKKWVLRGKKERDWELTDLALRTLPVPPNNDSSKSQSADAYRYARAMAAAASNKAKQD